MKHVTVALIGAPVFLHPACSFAGKPTEAQIFAPFSIGFSTSTLSPQLGQTNAGKPVNPGVRCTDLQCGHLAAAICSVNVISFSVFSKFSAATVRTTAAHSLQTISA